MLKVSPLNTSLKKQAGASVFAIMFNLAILIFAGIILSKIGSTYYDNYLVKQALESLDDVPFITKKSKRAVTEIVIKKFSANNVPLTKNNIVVEKRPDRLVVSVNYERRVALISNIDAVMKFENEFEAVKR